MRFWRQLLAALLVMLSAASSMPNSANTPASSHQGSSEARAQPVFVSGDTDGAPAGCSPADVTHRLSAMFQALNHGDPTLVAEFYGVPPSAPFQWYSIDTHATFDLAELRSYFQERYAHQEHLQLERIQFNGWEPARGLVHFGPLRLSRSATDLPPGPHAVEGKGAVHCQQQTIVVLSLATQRD